LSKFRSRDEEQFPPRKEIAPVFKEMEIVVCWKRVSVCCDGN